jgi:hypothetical protein
MPIIRITKQDVEEASKARKAALEKDPEFKALNNELEQLEKEAKEYREKEVKK